MNGQIKFFYDKVAIISKKYNKKREKNEKK